jgi:hypothetical protein
VRCPARKFTAHFPSLKQLWLVTHFFTCWKTGSYPNWIPIMTITFYNWTELPLSTPFSHECTSASQSCSSTALDRTCCKWETTTFSLGHPVRRILYHAISFFGGSLRQSLCATVAQSHPGTSWSDNECTAGHFNGHAAPSLGWFWLPCGPSCTHWRIVFNAWGMLTVFAADTLCYAYVDQK